MDLTDCAGSINTMRGDHYFPQGSNSEYRNVAAAFVSTHLWATLLSRVCEVPSAVHVIA